MANSWKRPKNKIFNTVDYTFECSSYFSSWNDKKEEDFFHDISVISIGHKQIHGKYRMDVVGPERQYEKNIHNTTENVCVAAINSHSVYEVVALLPSLENTRNIKQIWIQLMQGSKYF